MCPTRSALQPQTTTKKTTRETISSGHREKKQEDCPKGLYHSQVGVIVSRLEFKTVTAFRCTTADVPHSENGFQMRIRSVQLPGVLGDSDDFHIVALSY